MSWNELEKRAARRRKERKEAEISTKKLEKAELEQISKWAVKCFKYWTGFEGFEESSFHFWEQQDKNAKYFKR